ncbi:DET1 homolog isoform X2 [Nematostella vectensis]|uniref:DET1 homolog isoform X2 n=1 Tax=Nematostella vectensis TaxID=45351 RepID=UPI0020774D2F|nr:DET1 homolog isoform X2 [Nematostella vectensis]
MNGLHFKPRRVTNQNIVWKIRQRETVAPRPGCRWHRGRSFTQNLFPNFTIVNVEKPPCFLRKFSPDGRYFVAFSLDQSSIEVYEFQGASAAEELLAREGHQTASIRSKLFGEFFKQTAVVTVAANGEHLNRECSLFTDDGRYVIVGSASYVPEDPHPFFFDIYRNNESVSPNPRSPLEDYTIHIVDLRKGRLSDSRTFKCDKIFLSHNQGLYLYRDLLAILSVQQQTIHIFQVTKDGKFIEVRSIGRFCHEDDELVLTGSRGVENNQIRSPYLETCINGLKHRLMVHLWRCAVRDGSAEAIRRFFQHFEQFRMLRMWKMQLLDETTILIKYASEEVVTLRVADPNSQASFFVIYNMESTEVLAVFENTSEKLLELFEQFCDSFRNAILHSPAQFTCSASSNTYARQIQRRFKHTIINAKYGGHTEAVKRLLAQLPISSQSYSSSPYLDLSLFSYDDKWVSVMERPKACGDHPIRCHGTNTRF